MVGLVRYYVCLNKIQVFFIMIHFIFRIFCEIIMMIYIVINIFLTIIMIYIIIINIFVKFLL